MSAAEPSWASLDDGPLLDVRLDALDLRPEESRIAPQVARLRRDLERAEVPLLPRIWFSTDWFSPDGVPGIALPFPLMHARLVRLERKQLTWAEGSRPATCLRLLRHEAGHALDTAYRLSRTPTYRAAFGRRSEPYRRHYAVDPGARGFVRHLDRWYAQSHPAEDFAETFAVWLADPGGSHTAAADERVRAKLQAVEQLVASTRGRPAPVRSRACPHALRSERRTLREHYARRRRSLEREPAPPFDADLERAFDAGRAWRRNASAARHLLRTREALAREAGRARGLDGEAADQIVGLLVQRCRERGHELPSDPARYKPDRLVRMIRSTARALRAGSYLLSR